MLNTPIATRSGGALTEQHRDEELHSGDQVIFLGQANQLVAAEALLTPRS